MSATQLITTGAALVGGGPVAGAAAASSSGLLQTIETNWFGGASRDAARQLRVNWFVEAAIEGSVIAARVVLAAPNNVGSNEAKQWQAGWNGLQSARPDVVAAAQAAGGYWDSTDNATSDKMRALVNAELSQLGQITPGNIPSTQVAAPSIFNPINRAIGQTVSQAGAGITNSVNQSLGLGSFFNIPTSTAQLVLLGAVVFGVGYLIVHHHHKG